ERSSPDMEQILQRLTKVSIRRLSSTWQGETEQGLAPEGTQRPISRPAAPMPTEDPAPPTRNWLAGCIVHCDLPIGAPEVKIKINGKPFRALLDSGSAVSLVRSHLLPPRGDSKTLLLITCVHGETRQLPARRVTISAAPGSWPVEVGLMKDLPVPVLIGRDWPRFDRLLASATQPASRGGSRRGRRPARGPRQRPILLASDSRRDGESPSQHPNLFYDVFQQVTEGGSFTREQREDDRLKNCWGQVRNIDGKEVQPGPHPLPHFVVQNGLQGEEKFLLVVPRSKTETVLELAHTHPMAGCLGVENTVQRIRDRFHCPGLDAEVKRFCQACPTCQRTAPRKPPPNPLIPLPIIDVPFERIGMDLVGPLPKSARGHEHILVIVDYATRHPEAVPLRKATAKAIAQKLFLLFSRVGIPVDILTDQGTPFMSRLMADLCRLLRVKQLRTTVYHPQTDGLDRRDWDLMPQLASPPSSSFSVGNPVASWISSLQPITPSWNTPGTPRQGTAVPTMTLQPGSPTTGVPARRPSHGPSPQRRLAPIRHIPRAEQLCHVNLLKKWIGTRDQLAALVTSNPVVVDVNPHLCPEGGTTAPDRSRRPAAAILLLRTSPIVMVSEFDGYPMPRVDGLLDRLGRARYISTLDLMKGYWQVPLSETAKAKTAFSTPSGHWQYCTLAFSLHGAPATFQRMMDIILRPHQSYNAAYLDDVVIHSKAWEDHLDRLRRVLSELRRAGLTANPRKCHLVLHEVKYLRSDEDLSTPRKKSCPPDRPDQEGTGRENTVDTSSRGRVPADKDGPYHGS
ncbi:hypothetical protein M9458_050269, partial [Cirrhinus mrigala]